MTDKKSKGNGKDKGNGGPGLFSEAWAVLRR